MKVDGVRVEKNSLVYNFSLGPVLLQILLFTFCNSLHKIHKFCQLTELLGPTGGSALPQREDLSVCVEAAQNA